MSIWGHDTVRVDKDCAKREWRVYTTSGGLLCTVPWADAFKDFSAAPDYAEAVATCQGHEETCLSDAEEAIATGAQPAADNIVAVDFRRRRRMD